MTFEQKKVIERCKNMLKLVFPSEGCKVIFRLLSNSRKVKADVMYYDVEDTQEQKETVVDLRN